MAKHYNYPHHITYRCNHSADLQIPARYKAEAQEMAHRLRQDDCPACLAAKDEKEAQVNSAATTAGLPGLSGSPQQITWAMQIRQRIYSYLTKATSSEIALAVCSRQTSAKFWIESKSVHPAEFTPRNNSKSTSRKEI